MCFLIEQMLGFLMGLSGCEAENETAVEWKHEENRKQLSAIIYQNSEVNIVYHAYSSLCSNKKPFLPRRHDSIKAFHFFPVEILSLPYMSDIIASSAGPVLPVGMML